MGYEYISDSSISQMGYTSKDTILNYISEKQIFKLVFGFEPIEYEYVTSPLREDTHAGCWFVKMHNKLKFRDFGYKNKPLDCFDVVQDYFKLPSFYDTLKFVSNQLITKNSQRRQIIRNPIKEVKKVAIHCQSRNFVKNDSLFWKPFQITKQNLIDDKVFPFNRFQVLNSKKGNLEYNVRDIAYVYTDFKESRKKLYFPKRKTGRFLTNCKRNDIGNVNNLMPYGDELLISKSYKDARVLINQGKNVIWLHSEGMIPDADVLIPITKRFSRVIVFFDNDKTGIEAAMLLSEFINSYFPGKSSPMWLHSNYALEGISDPAELISTKGRIELNQILYRI